MLVDLLQMRILYNLELDFQSPLGQSWGCQSRVIVVVLVYIAFHFQIDQLRVL